jgi:hypothetical protein
LKALLSSLLLVVCTTAHAHDLITAELAEGYLNKATRWHAQAIGEAEEPAERAKAYLRIGVMLDEIRGYLNRDLAVHGEVQGLASNYLVAELGRVGTPLVYSDERRMFTANTGYYRLALELGLNTMLAKEARLRWLRGEFYDSFDVDPLQSGQDMEQLANLIRVSDQLDASVSAEPNREEVKFIAAILYARAARLETDGALRANYLEQALMRIDGFAHEYPDSLRSAAMPVVRAALDSP